MKTLTQLPPPDLLSLLRVVESTPTGSLERAKQRTHEQAAILRLRSPSGRVASIESLAQMTGIPIDVIDDIPVDGTAFPTKNGWRIHISASLTPAAQLRVALHELKHVIDHPLRTGDGTSAVGLSDADYEYLADHFADTVASGEP